MQPNAQVKTVTLPADGIKLMPRTCNDQKLTTVEFLREMSQQLVLSQQSTGLSTFCTNEHLKNSSNNIINLPNIVD